MIRALFALALLLFVLPAQAQTALPDCNQSVVVSTSATQKAVADPGAGNARVFVCGFTIVATAAATVQLIGGTGNACATSLNNNLTGVMSLAINSILVDTGYKGMQTQAGAGLCVAASAAVTGVLYYGQK